jgi:imidazolonepropionase
LRKQTPSPYLLLANIGQLVTVRGARAPRRGAALKEIGVIEDAAVFCGGGNIILAGPQREILQHPWLKRHRRKVEELDCRCGVVLPGLVDCHTHPAFVRPRLVDFEKRISGASYQDIANAGGGIRSSVDGVRRTTREKLRDKVLSGLQSMLRHGTSSVEAKSGYGLSMEDEIKSLEAIRDAARLWPGTIVATLLAAHVVPKEYSGREEEYVKLVCNEIIPVAARNKLATFVDVFCERDAFTLQQSERILAAAHRHGLAARAHIGQFTASSLGPLLAYEPASLDHLDHVADEDLTALARSSTIAVLLPGVNYFLGYQEFPSARRIIDSGAGVALATDFNPGTSPTPSLPFVMSLACTHLRMTPAEAITASTINASCALRLEGRKGSIEPGKDADLALFAIDDYREIAYWFAWNRCVEMVVSGQRVQTECGTA